MGTVTEYLDTVDPANRGAMQRVVDRSRELLPDLEEGVSYGMPALMYRGKPLLSVMETRRHLAIYPYSGYVVSRVAERLEGFSLSTGAIRFSAAQPVPADVLDDLVRLRRDEIERGRRRQPAPPRTLAERGDT